MPYVALVVDDSMLIRHTVCRFLEDRGFRVESAIDGAEALEILSELRPDIILTDLQMPRMDGHALIDNVQAKPETATIPIVVLSARNSKPQDSDSRARCVIYKDIDIGGQLGRALETIFPTSPTG